MAGIPVSSHETVLSSEHSQNVSKILFVKYYCPYCVGNITVILFPVFNFSTLIPGEE
jgi:hypothetical protein